MLVICQIVTQTLHYIHFLQTFKAQPINLILWHKWEVFQSLL